MSKIHVKVKAAALVAVLLAAVEAALTQGAVTVPSGLEPLLNLILPVIAAYLKGTDPGTT